MSDPKHWPQTPEEMEAKLAELRADPEKAAVFRADLHKRMKQAFEKFPKWPVPLDELISDEFSFLVDEYGFTEHEKTTDGFLGSVTVKEYSNASLQNRWTSRRHTCKRMPLLYENMLRMLSLGTSVFLIHEIPAQQTRAGDAFKVQSSARLGALE